MRDTAGAVTRPRGWAGIRPGIQPSRIPGAIEVKGQGRSQRAARPDRSGVHQHRLGREGCNSTPCLAHALASVVPHEHLSLARCVVGQGCSDELVGELRASALAFIIHCLSFLSYLPINSPCSSTWPFMACSTAALVTRPFKLRKLSRAKSRKKYR